MEKGKMPGQRWRFWIKKGKGHWEWIPEGGSGGEIDCLGGRGSHSKEDTSFSGYYKEGMVFLDEGNIFFYAQH